AVLPEHNDTNQLPFERRSDANATVKRSNSTASRLSRDWHPLCSCDDAFKSCLTLRRRSRGSPLTALPMHSGEDRKVLPPAFHYRGSGIRDRGSGIGGAVQTAEHCDRVERVKEA